MWLRTSLIAAVVTALLWGSPGALACSGITVPVDYDDRMKRLREPVFARLVGRAAYIDLAVMVSSEKSPAPLPEEPGDDVVLHTTDYHFKQTESLKGNSEARFSYRSAFGNEDNIPEPLYTAEGRVWYDYTSGRGNTYYLATARHRYAYFWNEGRHHVGNHSLGSDCATYVSFAQNARYLVLRDAQGGFLSAEQILHDDDLWLLAVRRLIADPSLRYGRTVTLKEYVRIQWPELIRVASCGRRPSFRLTNLETSKRQFKRARMHPWGTTDPYVAFPFDRRTCRVGKRFLATGFDGQWFDIDKYSRVELTNIAAQLEVTGQRRVPLRTLRAWLKEGSSSAPE